MRRHALAAIAVLAAVGATACGGAQRELTREACASADGRPITAGQVLEATNARGFELETTPTGCSSKLAASLSNIPIDEDESYRMLDFPGHLACEVHVRRRTVTPLQDPALTRRMGGDRVLVERRLANVKCSLFGNRESAVRRLDRALDELRRASRS